MTMLKIFTAFVAFLAASAVAHSSETLVSVSIRQTVDFPNIDCNSTCGTFVAVKKQCNDVLHCGCNYKYLRAQGDCLLCKASNPQDVAYVQLLLDAEINQCHEEGISIEFKLNLPPDAQTIVDKFNRKSNNLRHYQRAFLALQIVGGHIGLVVVLAFALFSRKVHRDTTVLNFCITWIFSSIAYSILLYRGTQGNTVINTLGLVPPLRCLMQASLINGAQVMTACSTMSLIIQLWIGLRATVYDDSLGTKRRQFVTYLLLFSPYILFLAIFIPSVFIGSKYIVIENSSLQRAQPGHFYCVVTESSFGHVSCGITLTVLLVTVLFDLHIIMILYKDWWAFRHTRAKIAVPLSVLLRMIGFSIFRVAVAVAYAAVLHIPISFLEFFREDPGHALPISISEIVWVDMLQATIPFVGFLVFGVNSEILSSLMFWRNFKKPTSTVPRISTTGTDSAAGKLTQNPIQGVEKANIEADV